MCWLNLVAAKLLEHMRAFRELGRSTLYLCGNEYLVKTVASCFLGVFGLEVRLESPLSVYIYTAVLLTVCLKIVIPFERQIFGLAGKPESGRLDECSRRD